MSNYYDAFTGKFAGYNNYGTYCERVTPFFDTVAEMEIWEEKNGVDSDVARPVANWETAKPIAADNK